MIKCAIGEKEYYYIKNAIHSDKTRDSYFNLAKKVFGLDFHPWYDSGFYTGSFIPYTLFDGDLAIASVGVAISNFKWNNSILKYAQLSTVMTEPGYRGRGLSKWLIDLVLDEWDHKSDCIYLYANDSVLNFYPRFGFEKIENYTFKTAVKPQNGSVRKLDLKNKDDSNLLLEKYRHSNPFSALTMENNIGSLMFHCITFLHDHIYYSNEFDAVIIAECDENEIFCYDIYTNKNCSFNDIVGLLATENNNVTLGFTPAFKENCLVEISKEKDTTIFVRTTEKSIIQNNKIIFPFLSRA